MGVHVCWCVCVPMEEFFMCYSKQVKNRNEEMEVKGGEVNFAFAVFGGNGFQVRT